MKIKLHSKLTGKAKLLPNMNHITPLRLHLTFPHIKFKVQKLTSEILQ